MKQYQHKITKKNAEQWSDDTYRIDNTHTLLPSWAIENTNDWEEIVERKVSLVTEDNVNLYKNDEYWWIDSRWNISTNKIYNDIVAIHIDSQDTIKRFSTKIAAQNYLLENKPLFSLKEILREFGSNARGVFKEFAKQKLGNE